MKFAITSGPGDITRIKNLIPCFESGHAIADLFDNPIGIPAKYAVLLQQLANLCIHRIHPDGNDTNPEIL